MSETGRKPARDETSGKPPSEDAGPLRDLVVWVASNPVKIRPVAADAPELRCLSALTPRLPEIRLARI